MLAADDEKIMKINNFYGVYDMIKITNNKGFCLEIREITKPQL